MENHDLEKTLDIKIAHALVDDAQSIAKMAYSAGPEIFDFMFETDDKQALDFIVFEYRSGHGFCGYRNLALAIKQDGEVVGTGSFYNFTDYLRMCLGTAINIFRFYGLRTGIRVVARTRHSSSVLRTPGLKEMYICNLGVKEGVRGAGIGSRLLAHHERVARSKGYRLMSLDVDPNNPNAQRLYERLGFRLVKRNKQFSGRFHLEISNNELEMILS